MENNNLAIIKILMIRPSFELGLLLLFIHEKRDFTARKTYIWPPVAHMPFFTSTLEQILQKELSCPGKGSDK
jgi:hypothetical protein